MTRTVKTTLSAFALVLALVVSACGTTGGSVATSTDAATVDSVQVPRGAQVNFWHIQATIYGDAIAEMVKQFNETNEWGIVVNQSYKGSYQELNQAVRAALTGGGAPNVTMAYENDTLQYVNAGEIVALDPYLASKKYGVTDAQLQDMFPGVLARQRVEAYNGKTLSWPHGNSAQGLYYDADLLTKAGITAPPTTWEEFLAQARKVKSATGVAYTAMGTAKNSYYYNILRSKGITPYDPVAKTTQFGSAASVQALQLLAQLYSEGWHTPRRTLSRSSPTSGPPPRSAPPPAR